jgi:hypothetical protein
MFTLNCAAVLATRLIGPCRKGKTRMSRLRQFFARGTQISAAQGHRAPDRTLKLCPAAVAPALHLGCR